MSISQLSNGAFDTGTSPNTGSKEASNTIEASAGRGIRAASAMAYQTLLGLASTKLNVPVTSLSVSNGVVSGGGSSVSYGELIGGQLFNVQMPASWGLQVASPTSSVPSSGGLSAGQAPAKAISDYKLVMTSPPRIDIPAIVTGAFTFIQNLSIPGMQHGRIVRPRGQAVFGFGAPFTSVDPTSIAHIPGAKVVQVGNFLGVVAPHEYDAIQAAAILKVAWAEPPAVLPGGGDEFEALRAADSAGKTVQSYRGLTGNAQAALASAAHVVSETYAWHTNAHTPIAPQCCVADVTPQGVRIFSGTQGAYATQNAVAAALGLPVSQVRVTAYPMGGAYGPGTPYLDAAQAAAIMSKAVGTPVRLQFMRWDELGWLMTPPGTLFDISAGVDGEGNLVGVDYTQFYPQYLSNGSGAFTSAELTGAVTVPSPSSSVSGVYDATAMYNVSTTNHTWLLKSLPVLNNWVQTNWMRCGSCPHATWAIEQTIDDLAHASGIDPVAFRKQNVIQDASGTNTQAQLLAVLNAVTQAANYQPKVSASQLSDATIVNGRGVAWTDIYTTSGTTKSAAIADIEVNKKTGKITVKHVYEAFTTGITVNPGLLENQLVGGITQVLSRLIYEQMRFSKTRTASFDFITYPIMRIMDSPQITPIVVQMPNFPLTGAGEAVTEVASAAVANAFFDATGVRLRTQPYSPLRVRAALKAAGIA
jgi:nicotinate dehydrogenase subunit B